MKIWNLPLTEYILFSEIEDDRPIALLTSGPAWTAVSHHLQHLNIIHQTEVTEATLLHWDALVHNLQSTIHNSQFVLYAVGGGLVVDAAKYLAVKLNKPLVCLPTALSVDAFLTWASGYRQDGCVYYLETKPPDYLMGKGLPHGDLVGPSILLIAEKQGQDSAPLRRALEACHIPLHNIPDEIVATTIHKLPAYARQHRLPYGIAHEL